MRFTVSRPLRRTLLYVPADQGRMLSKCFDLAPDGFIFDLEDAVAPQSKDAARETLLRFLNEIVFDPWVETWVRVNTDDGQPNADDVTVAAERRLSGVVVPKASPGTVEAVANLLEGAERRCGVSVGSTRIMALVETPLGIERLDEIVGSSERVVAVQLGAEDLALSMGVGRTEEGLEILYPRQKMAIVCAARGVDAIDTPHTRLHDQDGLRRDAKLAKSLGFAGKALIHPDQISTVREVFSPSSEEVAWANRIVQAYRRNGEPGSFALNGFMVDRPIVMRAIALMEMALRDNHR